jgi:hypothetical protein
LSRENAELVIAIEAKGKYTMARQPYLYTKKVPQQKLHAFRIVTARNFRMLNYGVRVAVTVFTVAMLVSYITGIANIMIFIPSFMEICQLVERELKHS